MRARPQKPVARLEPEGGPNLADIRLAVTGLRELRARIQKRAHKRRRARSDAPFRRLRSPSVRHELARVEVGWRRIGVDILFMVC